MCCFISASSVMVMTCIWRGVPQADIALGGLLNGSLAAMRAKTHAIKTQLNAASLTIKARRPLSDLFPAQSPVHLLAAMRVYFSTCTRRAPACCAQMFQAQQQMDRQLNRLERLADAGTKAEPRAKPADSGRSGGASAPEPASQPGAHEPAPARLDIHVVQLGAWLQASRARVVHVTPVQGRSHVLLKSLRCSY